MGLKEDLNKPASTLFELSFLPSEYVQKQLENAGGKKDLKGISFTIKEVQDWFKGLDVDAIELWIEGAIRDGKVTKLFLSPEGKAGCKLTIKPSETSGSRK
jgi:hypothetical protein